MDDDTLCCHQPLLEYFFGFIDKLRCQGGDCGDLFDCCDSAATDDLVYWPSCGTQDDRIFQVELSGSSISSWPKFRSFVCDHAHFFSVGLGLVVPQGHANFCVLGITVLVPRGEQSRKGEPEEEISKRAQKSE